MIRFQIGAAPVIPDARYDIGVLSLFPTQTATKKFGVYPIVQLSLRSFVVPVLTDTIFFLTTKLDDAPNAGVRALLSDKIFDIKNAVSFEIARFPLIFKTFGYLIGFKISLTKFGSLY